MSEVPEELRFTNTHEWAGLKDGEVIMGLTDYAQEEMGEIVMAELPQTGTQVKKGDVLGTIEAVKTAEDFYSPVDGAVARINEELESAPNLVNEEPYGKGWLVALTPTSENPLEHLMTAAQYRQLLGE